MEFSNLNLEGWDRSKQIGLIVAPCGSGKTYSSVLNFSDWFNVDPGEILLLVPRKTIKDQTLGNKEYKDHCSELFNDFTGNDGRVKVSTVQKIGSCFRNGIDIAKPGLVVVDEFHTLFGETDFADDLLYFQQLLQSWVADPAVSVVAMTATATLPCDFVNRCLFPGLEWLYQDKGFGLPMALVSSGLKPKYRVRKVQIEQAKALTTVLRANPASADSKQVVFWRGSTEGMMRQSKSEGNSTWLCSEYSPHAAKMNEDHLRYIQSGMLPPGIDRLYVSSAYREGFNIVDPAIREVVISGVTDIDIVQSLGRVRHDLERCIVVVDERCYKIGGKVRKALNLKRSDDPKALEAYYKRQERQSGTGGGKVPILVYLDHRSNEYRFNDYALYKWLHETYSFMAARKTVAEGETEYQGRKVPKSEEYFASMLGSYCDEITFNQVKRGKKENAEAYNKEQLESFDWSAWIGEELYSGHGKEEFEQDIGLRNSDWSVKAVTGIHKLCPQCFQKRRKQIKGKRETVYTVVG